MGRKQPQRQTVPQRPVDRYLAQYTADHQDPVNRVVQGICIPVMLFAVLGLIWMIPFPEIGFLKRHGYDTFLNWASFAIAALVYYYLRLSATLSYAVLLSIGVSSFFIVRLEYWEAAGGPAVWLVCFVLFLISLAGRLIGYRREKRRSPEQGYFLSLLIGPLWLWRTVFERWKIPY
jgi:uncharacterized membrane protein YGL010W